MCVMCRSTRNAIVRDRERDFMSLVIDPDAVHATVIARSAQLFKLPPQDCSLVHINGSRIANCALVEGDQTYTWTIGRYIRIIYSKTSSFKLGLFCEEQDSEVWSLVIA